MKISEAVTRTLEGDGIVTGRDDKGLYACFDSLRFTIGESVVELRHGDVTVGMLKLADDELVRGMTVIIRDIEGRTRLTFG